MDQLSFSQLKKNLKKDTTGFRETRLAVLGNCATQLLSQALRGYAYELKIALNVFIPRTATAGANRPRAMPRTMASTMRARSPNLIFFMRRTLYHKQPFRAML